MTRADRDDIRAAAHDWRAKNAAGDLTPGERAAFKDWMAADPRHGAVYAEAEVLWRALGEIDYGPEADIALAPQNSLSWWRQALRGGAAGLQSIVGRSLAGAAALAFLAMVLIGVQSATQPPSAPMEAVYRTATSELKDVNLDDGTVITLGAGSAVAVVMAAELRSVRLDAGEAYFDVAKDTARPFEVSAGPMRVRAVGTAFDVQRKAGALSVSVAEGAVDVSHVKKGGEKGDGAFSEAQSTRVAAGRRVAVSEATGVGEVVEAAAGDLAAWRSGLLVYYGASLEEVVSDANRHYARSIRIEADAARLKLSGSFRADDIDTMLLAMSEALPVEIVDRGAAGVLIKAVQ